LSPDEWKTWKDDIADLLNQLDRIIARLFLKGGLQKVGYVGTDCDQKDMNGPENK